MVIQREGTCIKHPNFFIIGAPRSGTTSLHDYLSQHPDIFMPEMKEPFTLAFKDGKFIDDDPANFPVQKKIFKSLPCIPGYDDYLKLFQGAKNQKAIGEASTLYMQSAFALENLRTKYPGSKLIVCLRNPVDQTYSSYHFAVRRFKNVAYGKEMEEFRDLAQNRVSEFLSHFDTASYYKYLRPYFDSFSPGQIHVVLFEDLVKNLRAILKGIFTFLEVDPEFVPSVQVRNKGAIYRSSFVNYLLHKSRIVMRSKNAIKKRMPHFISQPVVSFFDLMDDMNSEKPKPLPLETRKRIMAIFREDTQKLQDLIGRDLSHWLNV